MKKSPSPQKNTLSKLMIFLLIENMLENVSFQQHKGLQMEELISSTLLHIVFFVNNFFFENKIPIPNYTM